MRGYNYRIHQQNKKVISRIKKYETRNDRWLRPINDTLYKRAPKWFQFISSDVEDFYKEKHSYRRDKYRYEKKYLRSSFKKETNRLLKENDIT